VLVAAFITLIHVAPMVSTFGHITQERHLFYAWASGPEASPSWVQDSVGETPPYASVKGHKRMGMLMSQWL